MNKWTAQSEGKVKSHVNYLFTHAGERRVSINLGILPMQLYCSSVCFTTPFTQQENEAAACTEQVACGVRPDVAKVNVTKLNISTRPC